MNPGDRYLDAHNYSLCFLFVPVNQDTVYRSKVERRREIEDSPVEIRRKRWECACAEYRICLCRLELSASGKATINDNVFEYEVLNVEPQDGRVFHH